MPYVFNPFTGTFDYYVAGTEGKEGKEGKEGPKGEFTFHGAWTAKAARTKGDVVTRNGSAWACIKTVTELEDKEPGTEPLIWAILAEKGEKGTTGEKGEKGTTGEKGETGAAGLTSPNNRSFAINGALVAEAYPGFLMRIEEGEEYEIIGMDLFLAEGTEAEVTLRKNGAALGVSYEKVVVKKTETEGKRVSSAVVLKHADDKARFDLNVLAISGAPKDLYVTVYIKRIK